MPMSDVVLQSPALPSRLQVCNCAATSLTLDFPTTAASTCSSPCSSKYYPKLHPELYHLNSVHSAAFGPAGDGEMPEAEAPAIPKQELLL